MNKQKDNINKHNQLINDHLDKLKKLTEIIDQIVKSTAMENHNFMKESIK